MPDLFRKIKFVLGYFGLPPCLLHPVFKTIGILPTFRFKKLLLIQLPWYNKSILLISVHFFSLMTVAHLVCLLNHIHTSFKKIESDLYFCVENNFCCYLESKLYFLPRTFKQNLMKFDCWVFDECQNLSGM